MSEFYCEEYDADKFPNCISEGKPQCLKCAEESPQSKEVTPPVVSPDCEAVPIQGLIELCRFLAASWYGLSKARVEAMSLPPEECREHLILRSPIVQGSKNQWDIQKIGESSDGVSKCREAIDYLLALQSGTSQPVMTASQSVPTQKVSDSALEEAKSRIAALESLFNEHTGAVSDVLTEFAVAAGLSPDAPPKEIVEAVRQALKSKGTAEEDGID